MPYSRAYVASTVSQGSLPGLRAGTKPQPRRSASAPPKMKPRASAPRMMSARAAGPSSSSRSIVSWKYDGVRDQRHQVLEDDPGLGEVRHVADAVAQVEFRPEVTPDSSARRGGAARARRAAGRAPARPPRAPGGPPGRSSCARGCASAARARPAAPAAPPRGRPSSGTCAGGRIDAVLRQPAARRRDLGVALTVEVLAALDAWRQQAVLLERPRERSRRSRRARTARRGRAPLSSSASPAGRRRLRSAARAGGELLSDHAQRQELVALQPQDRLEPLDVLLAEEPVAATRALRRQQALILEVADLRDRDVRELRLQPRTDGADRVQALLGRRSVAVVVLIVRRKVRRYLPIWTSSSRPPGRTRSACGSRTCR